MNIKAETPYKELLQEAGGDKIAATLMDINQRLWLELPRVVSVLAAISDSLEEIAKALKDK